MALGDRLHALGAGAAVAASLYHERLLLATLLFALMYMLVWDVRRAGGLAAWGIEQLRLARKCHRHWRRMRTRRAAWRTQRLLHREQRLEIRRRMRTARRRESAGRMRRRVSKRDRMAV